MKKEILTTKNKKYKFLTYILEVLNIISFSIGITVKNYTICFILLAIMIIDYYLIRLIKQEEISDCEKFYKDIVKVK